MILGIPFFDPQPYVPKPLIYAPSPTILSAGSVNNLPAQANSPCKQNTPYNIASHRGLSNLETITKQEQRHRNQQPRSPYYNDQNSKSIKDMKKNIKRYQNNPFKFKTSLKIIKHP